MIRKKKAEGLLSYETHSFIVDEFKNKQQERFYWKTVRDVKKTLPFAKLLTIEMEFAEKFIDGSQLQFQEQYLKQAMKSYKKEKNNRNFRS